MLVIGKQMTNRKVFGLSKYDPETGSGVLRDMNTRKLYPVERVGEQYETVFTPLDAEREIQKNNKQLSALYKLRDAGKLRRNRDARLWITELEVSNKELRKLLS